MYIDYSPRRSGRTTRLIGWLLEDIEHRTIMCHSAKEARRVLDLVRVLVPDAPDRCVISSGQNYRGWFTKEYQVAIDNIEFVLPAILGIPVSRITAEKLIAERQDDGQTYSNRT